MATHDVKKIKDCALLLANDLRSGLTVYLTESGEWTTQVSHSWRIDNDDLAQKALSIAAAAEQENLIVGAYLVDAASTGEPTHIRERLRVDGPSINFLQNQS